MEYNYTRNIGEKRRKINKTKTSVEMGDLAVFLILTFWDETVNGKSLLPNTCISCLTSQIAKVKRKS